jgi:hypothetical protein
MQGPIATQCRPAIKAAPGPAYGQKNFQWIKGLQELLENVGTPPGEVSRQ